MLGHIRADLRSRKNLDTYATIAVAGAASVLSAFDVLSPEKTASVVMAVLAVLAFSTLVTRSVVEAASAPNSDRFQSEFPLDLISKRDMCTDMLLIGVSLSRTIESSYGALERNLMNAARVRVLLTAPDADAAALDARCQRSRPAIEEIRNEVGHSLRQLSTLKHATGGDLQVRLTRAAHKFGVNYFYPETRRAELHVQMYSYRLAGESRPMFTLTTLDGDWFDCFVEQAESMWEESSVFEFSQVST